MQVACYNLGFGTTARQRLVHQGRPGGKAEESGESTPIKLQQLQQLQNIISKPAKQPTVEIHIISLFFNLSSSVPH